MNRLLILELGTSPSDVTSQRDSIEIEATSRSQDTVSFMSSGIDDLTVAAPSIPPHVKGSHRRPKVLKIETLNPNITYSGRNKQSTLQDSKAKITCIINTSCSIEPYTSWHGGSECHTGEYYSRWLLSDAKV